MTKIDWYWRSSRSARESHAASGQPVARERDSAEAAGRVTELESKASQVTRRDVHCRSAAGLVGRRQEDGALPAPQAVAGVFSSPT